VYPWGFERGTFPTGLVGYSFNGGGCCPNANSDFVDDVTFTRDLIDYLKTLVNLDSTKIYATGMSNGGFMVNRLAC